MQRQHSSQATSTLGNTPNLFIGSYTGKTLYWFPDQNSPLLHPTGNCALVLLTGKDTLLSTLFFALHKRDSARWHFKTTLCFALASFSLAHFASIGGHWRISFFLRGFGLLDLCLPHLLDSCTSAMSGIFWIYRVVSISFNICWHSYCNIWLLAEDQVRLLHFFKSNKNILGWHLFYH